MVVQKTKYWLKEIKGIRFLLSPCESIILYKTLYDNVLTNLKRIENKNNPRQYSSSFHSHLRQEALGSGNTTVSPQTTNPSQSTKQTNPWGQYIIRHYQYSCNMLCMLFSHNLSSILYFIVFLFWC